MNDNETWEPMIKEKEAMMIKPGTIKILMMMAAGMDWMGEIPVKLYGCDVVI